MLDQLRQGAQGWVSKLLMVLLVLSFAIWGIGGFQGYGAGTLATVGDQDVSLKEFARAMGNAQRQAQQSGRQLNPDQVLSTVLMNAAIDDAAHGAGLGVSDDRVAKEIADNPVFQGTAGAFDRDRFNNLLAGAGIDRNDFVHDTKRQLVRQQIIGSLGAGLTVPQPIVSALYRLQNEERTVSYFTVDQSSSEPVGEPSDSDLQAYYDENKSKFRAPEYRKIAILTLDPAAIADPDAVTQDELQKEYDARKASLTKPERRHVEEIRFDSADAANAALARMKAGEDFSAVAAADGIEVTDLGVKTKAEMLDQAVGDAAFTASQGEPVAVTEGALQPSVIRVTAIEPGSVPTIDEIGPRLRKDIATRNARDHVQDLYDQVEDERAGGGTLNEAAAKLKLPYRVVDAVAADLRTPDGSTLSDLPGAAQVVKEAFDSDVGVENSPVRVNSDAYVFYDVLEITPDRDRTLDEVHDQVVAAWREQETSKRIADKATGLFDRLKAGTPLASLAAEIGTTVSVAEKVKRNGTVQGLTANAVQQAFAGPEGHVADAEGAGDSRILLKVDQVTAPAFFAEAADAKAIQEQLASAMQNDLLATFNNQLLTSRKTSINNAAYQQITGQAQTR